MNRKIKRSLFTWLVLLCWACMISSNDLLGEDFFKTKESIINSAWKRISIFYVQPTLTLENTGYTSNIFYYDAMEEPDWTADLGLEVQISTIIGKRLIVSVKENPFYSFYAHNVEQRSWSNRFNGTIYTYLGSFNLKYEYSNDHVRGRPNAEFGSYIMSHLEQHSVSMDVGNYKNFFVSISLSQYKSQFEDEEYLGKYNLKEGLNQSKKSANIILSKIVFTRTRLFLKYEYLIYEFEYTPDRNGLSSKASIGIEFPEISRIQGNLEFGVQAVYPASPLFRQYTKPFGSGEVNISLLRRLKLNLRYLVNNFFSFWSQEQDFDVRTLGAKLDFYITKNIKIGYEAQLGRMIYENLADGLKTRQDNIYSSAFSLGLRVFKNMGIGLEYRRYWSDSDQVDFTRNSDFIGGYLIHEF